MSETIKKRPSVMVFSHYEKGGGTPLDSLWFSAGQIREKGIRIDFAWTKKWLSSMKSLLRADLVIFDGAFSLNVFQGPALYRMARRLGKKIAVYWHETEWYIDHLADARTVERVTADAKVVHFHVAEYGVKMLVEKYGIDSHRCMQLRNIADGSRFLGHPLPGPVEPGLFVALGSLEERKGVDLFLEIAEKTVADRPGSRFKWIGEFSFGKFKETALDKEVTRRGLWKNVEFVGRKDDPSEILRAAEAVVLTSRDDPMPKTLMEALALGRKTVAFGVCGVPELLDGHGVIIEPLDTDAFARALVDEKPGNDPSTQKARRKYYLENFTTDTFVKNFEKAYAWWNGRE